MEYGFALLVGLFIFALIVGAIFCFSIMYLAERIQSKAGRKEQEELEAKYGAHNAELLEEFNKHHG